MKATEMSNELFVELLLLVAWTMSTSSFPGVAEAKGTGVISASGGSSEGVCVDCGSADKDGEMECALIILSCILMFFVVILACQCFNRIMFEFGNERKINVPPPGTKGMPPPPYQRQCFMA